MRAIVDLKEKQLEELNKICEQNKITRSEAIRNAIDWFASANLPQNSSKEAFGIWKDRKIDSLEYVDQLREEWTR